MGVGVVGGGHVHGGHLHALVGRVLGGAVG